MPRMIKPIFGVILLTFVCSLVTCRPKTDDFEMEWLTKEVEYEGIPLYLRKPSYQDVWNFQKSYTQLICISHSLDSVKSNGLPTADYNLSLHDFDDEVVDLFDAKEEGVILFVETYGGSRNYWFYASSNVDYATRFKALQEQNRDKRLEISTREDKNWDFIKDYPVKLY